MNRRRHKWRTVEEWTTLTREELEALPPDTVRCFDLGGVRVAMVSHPNGTWQVRSRFGVESRELAAFASAPHVRLPRYHGLDEDQ